MFRLTPYFPLKSRCANFPPLYLRDRKWKRAVCFWWSTLLLPCQDWTSEVCVSPAGVTHMTGSSSRAGQKVQPPASLRQCLPNWGLSSAGLWAVTRGVTCLAQSKTQRSGSQSKFRALAWETGTGNQLLVKDLLILCCCVGRPLFRWAGSSVGQLGARSGSACEVEPVKCCNCILYPVPRAEMLVLICWLFRTLHYPMVT